MVRLPAETDDQPEPIGTEPIETEQIPQEPLPTEEAALKNIENISSEVDALSDLPKGSTFRIMRGMLGALNARRIKSPGNAGGTGGLSMTAFRPEMWGGATPSQQAAADRRHAANKVARASRRVNRRRNR